MIIKIKLSKWCNVFVASREVHIADDDAEGAFRELSKYLDRLKEESEIKNKKGDNDEKND